MHLDLTTEALYVSNKKKDSSVSRVLRHPGLLWIFSRDSSHPTGCRKAAVLLS